jgi:hypothetical protein
MNKGGDMKTFAIFIFSFMILISGCATIKEDAKKVLGVSTKALEEGRKNAVSKTFNCDYNSCYNKTQEILKDIKAYIYAQDTKKQMIAVYVSEDDTTPVGIFFKEADAKNTQLEVSSPSSYAREFISAKLFTALEERLNPTQKEGKSDEKK